MLAVPRAHLLPMPGEGRSRPREGARRRAGFGNVHMVYRGGPVISNVKVFTVFWNASVPNQSALDAFYGTIVNSSYVDWLSEYDTPTQKIGRGSFIGTYVDPSPPGATQLTDDAIRQELGKLLDSGAVPAPDANTLFMMHFPAGVSITMDSAASCQQFCAYHSSFVHGSATVYYGIMPDFSGGCASCGGESTQLASTTVVASHEVAESMTDPNIGVANDTQNEKALAWYDDQNDEIGDVCEGDSATVAGWRVTKLLVQPGERLHRHRARASTGGGTGGERHRRERHGRERAPAARSTGSGTGGSGTGGGGTGGGGGGSRAHAVCSPGGALQPSCDACGGEGRQSDAYCCSHEWDRQCVGRGLCRSASSRAAAAAGAVAVARTRSARRASRR